MSHAVYIGLYSFVSRVINAGKSALNEDQACCEVVVARRRPMSYCPPSTSSKTSTAKRRTSLPNGEGLGLRMEHGMLGEVRRHRCTKGVERTGRIGKALGDVYVPLAVWHNVSVFFFNLHLTR